MAVAYETFTSTTTGTGTATNLVGTKPTGTVQGDLLLAYFSWRDATNPTDATVTLPSGWTGLDGIGATDVTGIGDGLYYKVAGGSEPANYTFTLSETQQLTLLIMRFSGADTTSPINVSSIAVNDVATSTSVGAPSITTTVDGCLLVFFASANGANAYTPPSGMTERADFATAHATTNVTVTAATETQTSAGATGTRTATQGSAVRSLARLIALKPLTFTGTAAVSLQKLTAVATGTVGAAGVTGTAAVSLQKLTAVATGTTGGAGVTGTAAVSLQKLTAVATGTTGGTGRATTGGATATTLACAPPSDAVAGDILVAFVAWRTSVLPTPPAGWTLIVSELHSITALSVAAYWRAYSISDTTYTWTFNVATAAAIAIRRYAGIDLTNPIDDSGGVETVNNLGTTIVVPSLSASAASAPLIVGASANGQRTFTVPGDLTEQHDIRTTNGVTDVTLVFGDGTTATAGSTGTRTITADANSYGVGLGVVLRLAAGGGGGGGGGSGGTGTGIIGVNRVEDGITFGYNNYLMAWGPFRSADLARITAAKIKVQGGGTAQGLRLVIYVNEYTGGIDQPGALIGAGAELTVSGAQAKAEVSIPAPVVTLARESDYWIGLWWGGTGNAIVYGEYRLGGSIRKTSTYSSTASPPAVFGTYSTGSVGSSSPHLYLEYEADLPGGADPFQIILEPAETALATAVSNYYAGPHRWRGNGAFVTQTMKDDYERWDWEDLEGPGSGTTSGTFTFSAIRAEIDAATAAGRRYAFRIRAETVSGTWVVPSDLNGITGSGFYNNATFQTRWKKIIDALGAEFDGEIAWFEAGPGQYGEWVSWSGTTATRQFLVLTPLNAFPNTPFVINVADTVSVAYALSASPRVGVRNDIYAFPSAANQITGIQSQATRAVLYRASQAGRLFLGEPGPQVNPSMLVYLNQARYYRLNTVGNANWDPTYASLSVQAKADVNEAYRISGYRIVLARVDAPATIDSDATQTWRFYWHNRNVAWAPKVGVWKAEVRLRSGASTIVATRTLAIDIRSIGPTGVAPLAVNENLNWSGVANGTYTLDVRVSNTILGNTVLGNSTLVSSGWYSVGTVTASTDATVAVALTGAFRVTGTPFVATIAALTPAAPFIPATSSGHRQRLQIGLYRSAGGQLVLDASHLADQAQWSTNQNGFRDLRLPLDLNTERAYALYAERGTLHMEVNSGPYTVWEGRLTDPSLRVAERSGVDLTALGYLDALNDLLYTALWSTTDTSQWAVARRGSANVSSIVQDCIPARFITEIGERLYIAPKKNAKHGETAYLGAFAVGALYYQIPSGSSRQIVRVSFTYEFVVAGSGWFADCYTINTTGGGAFVGFVWSSPSTGTGTVDVTVDAGDGLILRLYRSGTPTNFEYEDGDVYVQITNLRIKTTTGNASVDAVARDLITTIAAVNPTQIANDDTAIVVTGPDLADLVAEDSYGLELLTRLAAQSADTSGLAPVVRILRGRRLEVRSRTSIRGRNFLIDIDDLQIQQSRDNLINSVYPRYRGAGDRIVRGSRSISADSVSRYGIRRERMVEVDTTSGPQATRYRDAVLLDGADPLPRAKISVRKVYNERGVRVPNWLPEAWDTITITNLPPGVSDFDRIRTFVIAETTYTAATDTLEVSPESPLPTLDLLIAKGQR